MNMPRWKWSSSIKSAVYGHSLITSNQWKLLIATLLDALKCFDTVCKIIYQYMQLVQEKPEYAAFPVNLRIMIGIALYFIIILSG